MLFLENTRASPFVELLGQKAKQFFDLPSDEKMKLATADPQPFISDYYYVRHPRGSAYHLEVSFNQSGQVHILNEHLNLRNLDLEVPFSGVFMN